nr:PRTRC system ThiF family protein [uncultured Sphingobacterium sp.]
MKTLTAIHFTDKYLLNTTNPVSVNLIGAGGTGSQMLTALARISHSLISLGHAGLQVNLFDDDVVTTANQGRQLFADAEVGLYKSVALVNRNNRFFGTNWKAVTQPFSSKGMNIFPDNGRANIYISCVDTASARFDIATALENLNSYSFKDRNKPMYWMDFGNSRNTGQVVLSTIGTIPQPASKLYRPVSCLPSITEEFKELLEAQDDSNEPSCSLAEALTKQNLFINSSLASEGAALLWDLFHEGMTENRGFFKNLKNFRTEPIKVAA